MNAAANTSGGKFPLVGMATSIIVLIGVLVAFYYLYKFLYNPTSYRDTKTLFSGTLNFSDCKGPTETLAANQRVAVKGITDGGEFTFNTWLYISDARVPNAPGVVHLFEIGKRDISSSSTDTAVNNKQVILFGGLVPSTGALMLRMGTTASSEQLKGGTVQNLLNTSYSEGKCDIKNIEYQRWILVTTVVNSRTMDVYIDGKLARSCVYQAPYTKSTDLEQNILFGLGTSTMKGVFSNPTFSNYAMSPDEIWNIYMTGPQANSGFLSWLKDYFSIEVKYKVGDTTYTA